MKIKSFSTEQFAGIRTDKPITFADGMNVVLGNNEAGKSTMISAIDCALNKPVKLNLRKDSEFMEAVFPTGGEDTVDATVCFQDKGQDYTVKKVWDRTGDATAVGLKIENAGLLRGGSAEEALKKTVRFGAGVYKNLIFGRQNNEDQILEWCYGFFSSKVSDDVTETKKKIAEAFSAAGGISPDKFLNLIDGYIKGIGGNWDFERDQPKKNTSNKRWKRENGSIIEAYYAYEDAKEERDSAVRIEEQIVEKTEEIADLLKEKSGLESEREKLTEQFGAISGREQTQELYKNAEKDRKDAEDALTSWPEAEKRLTTLDKLRTAKEEQANRTAKEELCRLIGQVRELEKANQRICGELEQAKDYEEDEAEAKALSGRIQEIRGMLAAAKLRAQVAMEPGYKASIFFADGTEREVSGTETMDGEGFVRLNIPGVASVQVFPQELDLEGLQSEQMDKEQALHNILRKYGADTLEELGKKCGGFRSKELTREENKREAARLLRGKTIEEYEEEESRIVVNESISIPDSLDEDIRKFLEICGKDSLDVLKGALEAAVEGYVKIYGTPDELPQRLSQLTKKEKAYSEKLQKYENTPCISVEEYEAKVEGLKKSVKDIEDRVSDRQRELGTLSTQEVTDIEGLETKVEEAEQTWLHEKKKYEYYTRIKRDFAALRSQETDHLDEFCSKFGEYLGMITGGRISLNPTDSGLCLQSGALRVDSGSLLSEGTKKTVLLAFRLAVLEYFFPDGDGLVVLDDDLLDMDPARREQAAKLLNKFAASNQVIFTTCDPAIAELLGGNLIPM